MADLVSGRYPQQNYTWSVLGQQNNLAQSDVPLIHNMPYNTLVEDGAAILTKEETIFPVCVPWGVSFEKISLVGGATETETLGHAWAAVRSGVTPAAGEEFKPVLLGQSKDNTGYKMEKTETVSFTLEKAILSTPENAPRGYLYFSIFMEGTKVGTYASFKCPAAALNKASSGLKVYPWFTGAPIYCKSKPGSAATAEKEPKEAVLVSIVPVVFVQ